MSKEDIDIEELMGKLLYIIIEHKGLREILHNKNFSVEEKKLVYELYKNFIILNTITDELPKKPVVVDYDNLIKKYNWEYKDYKDYDYRIEVRKDRQTNRASIENKEYYDIIKKYIEQNKQD